MATCHPLRVPVCFDRLSSSSNASPSWHSSNNLPLGVHHNNHNVGQTGPSDPNHLWGVVSHPHSSDHSAEAPCSSSHLALDHGFQPSSLLAINLPLFNPADHQAIPTLEPLGPETDGRICLGLRNGRVRIYSEAALLATSASQFSASPGIPIDRKHSSSSVSLATAASSSRQSAATSSETPKAPPPFAGFGANQGSNRIRSASSSSLGFGNPSLTGPSTSAENAVSADGQAVQPSPKEAEAELELQWHASERSELSSHSHGVVGVVGGVFAKWSAGKEGEHPHEHVVKKQRRASKAQAEQAQGQTSDDGTRRSGVIPSSAGERDPFQQTTFPDITKRLPLKEEDSGDQLYRPLAEFLTPDSSPVIGLHVYRRPTLSGTRSLCLLSVQEEGRISSWSLETGEMVWDLDLALVASDRMTSISDPNKPEVGAPSGGLVRFPSLLALRSQTGSPSPSAKASFTECTGEDVGDDKFQERIAVRIGASEFLPPLEAGLFPLGSLSLWDMRSERLLLLDPQGGKIILSQLVEKATPSFRPRFIVESGSLKAEWIEEGSPLKMVKRTISVTSSIPTSPERETLRGSESSPDLTTSRIPLPTLDSFSPDRIWKVDNFVFTTSPSRFHILEAGEDKFTLMHQFDLDGVRNLLLSPSDETSVILMRSDGYACINLDSMNIIQSSLTGIAMLSQYASSAVFASSPWTRPTRPIFGAGYDETKGTFVFQAIDPSTGSLQNQFEEKFRRQIGDDGEQTCSISCLLPLSLEKIVVSLTSGHLCFRTLAELVFCDRIEPEKANAFGDGGGAILLKQVTNSRSGSKHIVGGSKAGDIAIWDSSSLLLQATWTAFQSPVVAIQAFGNKDSALRLHGCIACVSADSTVAIILLDGLKILYSIPGRDARLSSMAVRADEMLLIYDDEKARMWDMRTQELRRSVGTELAKSLLEDGTGWWSYYPIHAPGNEDSASSKVLSKIASARHGAIATLLTDYRRAIEVASRLVDPPASQYANATDEPPLELAGTTASRKIDSSIRTGTQLDTAVGKKVVTIIRPLLATVLPHSDALARNFSLLEKLRLGDAQRNWNVSCGIFGPQGSLARPILSSDLEGWQLSPTLTTHRLLVAIGLLKVLANITEIKDEALQLIQFLTHELPAELPGFKELSLPLLSRFILDSNQEIQEASRLLFSSCLQRLPDQQLEWLCEEWHELLPCKQPPIPADDAPVALLMLGLLAAERYKSLNPRLLKDISTSISIYICDEARPTNQAIAIELCHRGFDIWQHYLDAMEVVRTLFSLATNKESNTVTENRAAARLATLQIATANTPLFMTTLSLDILHARSPSHCSATMRLVAFMVRRKPLILYPNLPRLAEAVVKSLDPTITSMREAVVQAATVMINELVSTYPSIAFHGRLQRLAVGTHEGAVIMYDLKTATRLYVIEGHRRQLTGCSFSPDGRRLVTISLDERKLLIWKVGSGFTSMFSPGTIPRQGGADSSGAYKAIDFNVGDATSIDPETILNSVSFDWQNDRSVHVKIGEARVNLSVN